MYNQAKLLKDVIKTFIEDSPGIHHDKNSHFQKLSEKDKNYWRWKAELLLKHFGPHYTDSVGEIVSFSYIDKDKVLVEWLDENDEKVVDDMRISIDEFIEHELSFVKLIYPTIEELEMELKADQEKLKD